MTHSELMAGYYSAREAQELRAECYGYGYATETADFYATQEARLTFKDWLIANKEQCHA